MNKTGKIVRIVAIVMFGFTTAMNLLGGVGTSCVAFSNNVGFRLAFKELMDFRWLYQALVVITILIGLAGIWATIKLVRGGSNVYRNILIILIIGSIFGGVQYFASMSLRGEAAPANVKFFLNLLTLILFLLFLIPRIWKTINFDAPGGKGETKTGAGLAAIVAGIITLTIFIWAGPSHTISQQNWTYVLQIPLVIVGTGLTLLGIVLLGQTIIEIFAQEIRPAELQPSESNG